MPDKTKETIDPVKERVQIYIPKDSESKDPNLFVGHNGINYILPKGKSSLVPPEVAAEIMRSRKAVETQDMHIDEMLNASK